MRIVLNGGTDLTVGSTRIYINLLSEYLISIGVKAAVNDWDNYDKYDVAILGKGVGIEHVRDAGNRHLLVGIVHPSDATKKERDKLRDCDFAIVGSIEEKDYYLKYQENVVIFPQIERIAPILKEHTQKDIVVIGYHGNLMHLESMSLALRRALEELANHRPIELKAIYNVQELGIWKRRVPNIRVQHVQWNLQTINRDLLECDIGIVPACGAMNPLSIWLEKRLSRREGFANDYFMRFKNNSNAGRAFVFHQLGIPVVAEFIPSHFTILGNPENGFLAYSKNGWYQALQNLSESSDLRQAIAERALAEFNRIYDPSTWADRLAMELDRLLRARTAR